MLCSALQLAKIPRKHQRRVQASTSTPFNTQPPVGSTERWRRALSWGDWYLLGGVLPLSVEAQAHPDSLPWLHGHRSQEPVPTWPQDWALRLAYDAAETYLQCCWWTVCPEEQEKSAAKTNSGEDTHVGSLLFSPALGTCRMLVPTEERVLPELSLLLNPWPLQSKDFAAGRTAAVSSMGFMYNHTKETGKQTTKFVFPPLHHSCT